jgi:hypothetical protein
LPDNSRHLYPTKIATTLKKEHRLEELDLAALDPLAAG